MKNKNKDEDDEVSSPKLLRKQKYKQSFAFTVE